MGHPLRARPTEEYRHILRELSAIGNNINQIARIANSTGYVDRETLRRAVDMLSVIRMYIKETG